MTDLLNDWNSSRAILDEILYRDPSGQIRQIEVVDGSTRMVEVVTFVDGSKLVISALVPFPPLDDMTPKRVSFLKVNGERGEKWDDGSGEALDLARQSIAIRLLEKISKSLDEIPEREKIACPACNGIRYCTCCGGQGCQACRGDGFCPDCSGHGLVGKA